MTDVRKTVLITGGGSGIGRHLVARFAEEGWRVAVLEFDSTLCGELRECALCETWQCDVSDPAQVDNVIQAVVDSGCQPNVLINNAGIIHSEPLINLLSRDDKAHSRETWKRVIRIDLDSVFYVTSRLVEQLLSRRRTAVVISISSIAANGNAGQSAYSAAKAGVNSLTKTWAKELGPFGFRFAAVAPGFLDTPSTRSALSESNLKHFQQLVPLKRLGNVDNVFQAVKYVIENDYVNGTVLEVDGGLAL